MATCWSLPAGCWTAHWEAARGLSNFSSQDGQRTKQKKGLWQWNQGNRICGFAMDLHFSNESRWSEKEPDDEPSCPASIF